MPNLDTLPYLVVKQQVQNRLRTRNGLRRTLLPPSCLHCYFTFVIARSHNIFHIDSIAADKKRPLNYSMPQSVHSPQQCRVQTLPLIMHYGGEKKEKK